MNRPRTAYDLVATSQELAEGRLFGIPFDLWREIIAAATERHIGIADVPDVIRLAEIRTPD